MTICSSFQLIFWWLFVFDYLTTSMIICQLLDDYSMIILWLFNDYSMLIWWLFDDYNYLMITWWLFDVRSIAAPTAGWLLGFISTSLCILLGKAPSALLCSASSIYLHKVADPAITQNLTLSCTQITYLFRDGFASFYPCVLRDAIIESYLQ